MNETPLNNSTKGRTPPPAAAPRHLFDPAILIGDWGVEGALVHIDAHLQEWRGIRAKMMINHCAVGQTLGKDKAQELEKAYKEACTAIANLETARATIEAYGEQA